VECNSPVPRGTEGKEQVLRVRREAILVYRRLEYREESTDENDVYI
jgi:hypothetical protein